MTFECNRCNWRGPSLWGLLFHAYRYHGRTAGTRVIE